MMRTAAGNVSGMPTAEEKILSQVWRGIRRQNPALPQVEFVVMPMKRQLSNCAQAGSEQPHILVAAETLRSPTDTLNLILHFAAHCLAGGGLSASSNSNYHTAPFRQAAAQLGLETQRTGTGRTYGATTVLADPNRYARELELLSGIDAEPESEN